MSHAAMQDSVVIPHTTEMTMPRILETIDEHITWMRLRNMRPTTIAGRTRLLRSVAESLSGQAAGYPTGEQLALWQASLTSVGPDTMANYVSHLRAYFGWQQLQGLREDNPALRLVIPRLGRRLPRPIDTGDLLRAVDSAPDRIRPWLVCAAWGGLRCVEIALLRRENVRESEPDPFIIIAAGATKGRSERTVPMPRGDTLYLELLPLLPRRGWVFRRYDGHAGPNTPNRISAEANEYLRGLELADTMHSLRHWFGTRAYEASRDPRAVQELLGHRSLRSTEGYTKISDAARIAAVAALPQRIMRT
jgi:integrase